MKAQLCSLVRKLSQTVAIVNINEMYYRALQVLHPSESKIAIPQYSYLFYPRTPIVICDCIYTFRWGHSLFHLFCFSFVP